MLIVEWKREILTHYKSKILIFANKQIYKRTTPHARKKYLVTIADSFLRMIRRPNELQVVAYLSQTINYKYFTAVVIYKSDDGDARISVLFGKKEAWLIIDYN